MKSAAGLGKGLFSANQRGSVWPCGEMMGRSRDGGVELLGDGAGGGFGGEEAVWVQHRWRVAPEWYDLWRLSNLGVGCTESSGTELRVFSAATALRLPSTPLGPKMTVFLRGRNDNFGQGSNGNGSR